MDSDGYPTEAELDQIRNWDPMDLAGLFDHVADLWSYPDRATWDRDPEGRKVLHLSTGGWSGNEDVIAALMDNRTAWLFSWLQSRRGGHYQFRLLDRAKS